MEENHADSCFTCRHYTDSLGEKGYCMLYRHETTLPSISCVKHEIKTVDPKKIKEYKTAEKPDSSRRYINFLAFASFFSSTVLTVIAMLFALYFCITVFSVNGFETVYKVVILLGSLTVALFFTYMLYTLGKKFLAARLIELFFTVFIVVYVLMNYNTIWFSFHNLILEFIDLIFSRI